ncbi:MAG: hypothetical protein NVS3B20_09660 [Polyangiales bacterium]
MPNTVEPAQSSETVSFEESIRRLGEIVKHLEGGELSLEESLKSFERGIALARDAQRNLDAAEARVDELLGVDDQGKARTKQIAAAAAPATAQDPSARKSGNSPGAPPVVRDEDDLPF